MVIVHNIQTAFAQIRHVLSRKRIHRKHRNPEAREHLRKFMIHQRIILIRSGRQYNCKSVLPLYLPEYSLPLPFQLRLKRFLRAVSGRNRPLCITPRDLECLRHIPDKLTLLIFLSIPVKERCVIRNRPLLFGMIRIPDHQRISFHHRAHGLARLFHIL